MPSLNPREMARKDEVAFSMSDLAVSGQLNDKQLVGFKEIIQLKARLLEDTAVEIIDQAKMKWEYAGFTTQILHTVDENDQIAPENYTKLATIKIPFDCKDFAGAIPLSDKSVRNSIEKGNLGSFVMRTALPRVGLDMQKMLLLSKSNHANPDFQKLTGFVEQARLACISNGNLVNPASPQLPGDALLYSMEVAHPEEHWDDLDNMRFYCSRRFEAAYAYTLKGMNDAQGYLYKEQDSRFRLRFDGVPIFPLAHFPDNCVMLTHKSNVVTAIEQNVTWELEREPKKARYLYHIRVSLDGQFAVPEAVTLHTNVHIPVNPTE
jgi:hypothetical protein